MKRTSVLLGPIMIRSSCTLMFSVCILLTGCVKRYLVKNPEPPQSPKCELTQAYALLNAGLNYLPFNEIFPCDNSPATKISGQSLRIQPGMRIHINQFPSRSDGKNTQVPPVSSYEWTMPDTSGGKLALTRNDYLFVSYLLNTALPSDHGASKYNSAATLALFSQTAEGKCTPQPGCRQQLAISLLTSLTLNMQCDVRSPATSLSAASIREWLNPTDPELSTGAQSLSFEIRGTPLKLFDDWDEVYFASPAKEVGARTRQSTFYDFDHATVEGHALIEIDVPVRIDGESKSRYFPVYWSIADVERSLGAPVIGLRRREIYLSKALQDRLVPPFTQNPAGKSLVGHEYFTVWFRELGHFKNRYYVSLGAAGYVFPAQTSKNDSKKLDGLKEQALVAAGDVLILGDRKSATLGLHTPVTDDPGFR
jgi:hypothetical protein